MKTKRWEGLFTTLYVIIEPARDRADGYAHPWRGSYSSASWATDKRVVTQWSLSTYTPFNQSRVRDNPEPQFCKPYQHVVKYEGFTSLIDEIDYEAAFR